MVDDFIGRKFGVQEQLTVLYRADASKDCKYALHCSTCALDSELYGDAMFYSHKGNLIKGFIPCGCKINPSYRKDQVGIVLNRVFEGTSLSFVRVVEGYKELSGAKVEVHCKTHDYNWSTSTFGSLKSKAVGCPLCKIDENRVKRKALDEDLTKKFTKSHPDGFFTRSGRKTVAGHLSYWNYHCPICSTDEYVTAGLCTGEFEAFSGSFQAGAIPCRCAKAFYYTKEQREYKIIKTLAEENSGIVFKRWKEKYNGGGTKVVLECPEHGEFDRVVNSFISAGNHRCPMCAKHGFKTYKEAVVYVIKTSGFTGYGITNSFETRITKHWRNIKDAGLEIYWCDKFYMQGHEAQKIEKDIKMVFPVFGQSIEGFKTEATYRDFHKYVLDFVVHKIKEYKIDDPRNNDSIG